MYILFYVKGCEPKLKTFKTKKAAEAFAKAADKTGYANYPDDWADLLLKGTIVKRYSGARSYGK